jgi:hypothetical protein
LSVAHASQPIASTELWIPQPTLWHVLRHLQLVQALCPTSNKSVSNFVIAFSKTESIFLNHLVLTLMFVCYTFPIVPEVSVFRNANWSTMAMSKKCLGGYSI